VRIVSYTFDIEVRQHLIPVQAQSDDAKPRVIRVTERKMRLKAKGASRLHP
jgi:hypothetical protein